MFVTRLQRSRRHVQAAAVPYTAPVYTPPEPGLLGVSEPPFTTRRLASRRHARLPEALYTSGVYASWPSYQAVETKTTEFDRRLRQSPEHNEYPETPFVEPVSPTFTEPPFVTRRARSRRHQWASELLHRPFPVVPAEAPWPSFEAVRTLKASFDRKRLALPEHNEYPAPPGSFAPVGGIFAPTTLRRRSRMGLFLVAAEYLEADVVQIVAAVQLVASTDKRSRRRTHKRRLIAGPPINYVEALPPAGEEFEVAWRAVSALRRVDTTRTLGHLPMPVIAQEHSPGWKIATALRRHETSRHLQALPTLSFFRVPGYDVPSFLPWPTLKRRDISRRTTFPLAPPDFTVAPPPIIGAQGYPAFIPATVLLRRARPTQWQAIPLLVPAGDAVSVPGLQPPHYVIGRMSEIGIGLKAPMSLAGITVDGRMAPTHAVDGSFDPSEGHGGSVL